MQPLRERGIMSSAISRYCCILNGSVVLVCDFVLLAPKWPLKLINQGSAQLKSRAAHWHLWPDTPRLLNSPQIIYYACTQIRDMVLTTTNNLACKSHEWTKQGFRGGLTVRLRRLYQSSIFEPELICYHAERSTSWAVACELNLWRSETNESDAQSPDTHIWPSHDHSSRCRLLSRNILSSI